MTLIKSFNLYFMVEVHCVLSFINYSLGNFLYIHSVFQIFFIKKCFTINMLVQVELSL